MRGSDLTCKTAPYGVGCRVWGAVGRRMRMWGAVGCRMQGSGCRVQGEGGGGAERAKLRQERGAHVPSPDTSSPPVMMIIMSPSAPIIIPPPTPVITMAILSRGGPTPFTPVIPMAFLSRGRPTPTPVVISSPSLRPSSLQGPSRVRQQSILEDLGGSVGVSCQKLTRLTQ